MQTSEQEHQLDLFDAGADATDSKEWSTYDASPPWREVVEIGDSLGCNITCGTGYLCLECPRDPLNPAAGHVKMLFDTIGKMVFCMQEMIRAREAAPRDGAILAPTIGRDTGSWRSSGPNGTSVPFGRNERDTRGLLWSGAASEAA